MFYTIMFSFFSTSLAVVDQKEMPLIIQTWFIVCFHEHNYSIIVVVDDSDIDSLHDSSMIINSYSIIILYYTL